MNSRTFTIGLIAAVVAVALPMRSLSADEQMFDSAEAAVTALTDAAKAKDTNAIHAIFGPEGQELISPDVVQATAAFKAFEQRLTEKTDLAHESDTKVILEIGADAWPFPIPLVQKDSKWFFDVAQGKEEILNRRIGGDELGVIDVCHAYVEAQREYASADHNGDQVLEYAQNLRSTTNTQDGLYWPAHNPGDEESPLGPLIAQARAEGYHKHTGLLTEDQTPYHGYYFKILTRQGKHTPGGKYCYIVNGHMIGGFALVAWPAEYGNTGIMTFIVNQQGQIYQKDLGKHTASCAGSMKTYDPDKTWKLAEGK